MMNRTGMGLLIGSISLAFALSAEAQRGDSAFTASGRSCDEITWQPSVLARFPNIADACLSVEEYDGREYVRFEGTVRSVSASGDRLTMEFEGMDDAIELQPEPDTRVAVEGQSTRVRDLERGQELTFHVPASSFVAHFFEPGSETQFAEAELAPAAAVAQVAQTETPRRLPQTASALPLIGLLGVGLMAFGAMLLPVIEIARRR